MKKVKLIYLVYILFIVGITLIVIFQTLWETTLKDVVKATEQFIKLVFFEKMPENQQNQLIEVLKINQDVKELFEFHNSDQFKNSLGFKDVEWQVEKPESTYRIVAIGDSMTEGFGVSMNDTWPNQLESRLNNLNISMKFEVLNMGQGGLGTFGEVEIFKKYGLNYSPDMVILQFYVNDWESPELVEESKELWEKYRKGEYMLPLRIINMIKQSNISEGVVSGLIREIIVMEYTQRADWEEEWDKWVKEPLVELIDITKKNNIKLIVIAWDINKGNVIIKEKLTSLLSEDQVPFYDFSEYLSSPCSSDTRLLDCHLSALGYEIVANKTLYNIENEFYS